MNMFVRKILAWGSMGFAFLVLAFFTLPHYRQGESSIAGKIAEEIPLTLSNGQSTKLTDYRGKVVVLNFWATWCPPCVEETPALMQLQQRIASRNGVVLGVSVDEDEAAYRKFLQDHGINYPTSRDPSKKSALDYGTVMYPETYIIDRHGKIARKVIGPQDWNSAEMNAYFDAILGQS
jgi:cytochrome c biogenesis protein CcmG/thiol:disulfide interchange protein DsbE